MQRGLRAVGLYTPQLRAWALYDWANSTFATTIMAAVLPVYYATVAGDSLAPNLRTAYWGYTATVALIIIALISPVLGAVADYLGARKRLLAGFLAMGVLATACLYFVQRGEWLLASCLYVMGNVGFAAANSFYESLLPHVARPGEVDRVSTAGYAVGYIGGGVLLAINLAWIQFPSRFGIESAAQASRLSFLSVALWWAVFSIPLFVRVAEPARLEPLAGDERHPLSVGLGSVVQTLGELRQHRPAFMFLLAFWFYNDGINTIIKMAAIYGAEVGLGQADLIGALLLVQFIGVPCTFAYGALASRIGAKRGIYIALGIYCGICVMGYFLREAWHFWALAVAVGLVQGGSQALSRSFFATLIPRENSAQFFGFYSVSGKFGNIVGPSVFAAMSQLTGSGRYAILSLVFFFAVGALLLSRVDIDT